MPKPQDHEVPSHDVRQFVADVNRLPLIAYDSLDAARRDPDSAVVLSGDYGGTIFLTAPVRLVRCSLSTLQILVSDLDAVTWMSGDPTIATVAVEHHLVGSGVMGGDGGGLARKREWRSRQPPLPRNLPWDFDISAPAVPFD